MIRSSVFGFCCLTILLMIVVYGGNNGVVEGSAVHTATSGDRRGHTVLSPAVAPSSIVTENLQSEAVVRHKIKVLSQRLAKLTANKHVDAKAQLETTVSPLLESLLGMSIDAAILLLVQRLDAAR